VNGAVVLLEDDQRLAAISRVEHRVANALKRAPDVLSDPVVVLDEEDGLVAGVRFAEDDALGGGLVHVPPDPREVDLERRTGSDFAAHQDVGAALLDDSVNGGQPQPRSAFV
jgi:hypothetical protein